VHFYSVYLQLLISMTEINQTDAFLDQLNRSNRCTNKQTRLFLDCDTVRIMHIYKSYIISIIGLLQLQLYIVSIFIYSPTKLRGARLWYRFYNVVIQSSKPSLPVAVRHTLLCSR